jgi:hypothetical protein
VSTVEGVVLILSEAILTKSRCVLTGTSLLFLHFVALGVIEALSMEEYDWHPVWESTHELIPIFAGGNTTDL